MLNVAVIVNYSYAWKCYNKKYPETILNRRLDIPRLRVDYSKGECAGAFRKHNNNNKCSFIDTFNSNAKLQCTYISMYINIQPQKLIYKI